MSDALEVKTTYTETNKSVILEVMSSIKHLINEY